MLTQNAKKYTYAELGSELDHATAETQARFARAFHRHADPALVALGVRAGGPRLSVTA